MSRIDFTLIEFPVVSASDPVHGTATLPDAGSAAGGAADTPPATHDPASVLGQTGTFRISSVHGESVRSPGGSLRVRRPLFPTRSWSTPSTSEVGRVRG